jgi:hypothetical protein
MVFFSFKVRGMNTPQNPENDIHYADTQHPLEHIEPLPQEADDSIERNCQVLGRTIEWVAEADEPSEKGLRAAVVLYCVRSDLIGRERPRRSGLLAPLHRERCRQSR